MRDRSGSFAAYLRDAMRIVGIEPDQRGGNAELARRAGLSQTQVGRWLNQSEQPTIENLRKLAPVLGVRMPDLLVAAEYISPTEAGLEAPEEGVPSPTTEEKILGDPRLTEREKRMMLAMLAEARDRYAPGEAAVNPDSAAVEDIDEPRESA